MNKLDTQPEMEAKDIEQDRVVLLSDGIFAIAITLLVLDIRVPETADINDMHAIVQKLLPHFAGYTISFIVIASYWFGHRWIMRSITRVDRNFLWLNFLFLFFVAVFPVSTSLLGQHFGAVIPTIIYALFSSVTGFSLWGLWFYASSRAKLLHPRFDPREIQFHRTFYFIRSIIYLISLFVLLVPYGTYLFFGIWVALVPLLIWILRHVFPAPFKAKNKQNGDGTDPKEEKSS